MLTTVQFLLLLMARAFLIDYGIPGNHKATVGASWSTVSTDIMADIKRWQDVVEDDTGVRPTRAICNSSVWNAMLANTGIRNTMFVYSNGVTTIADNALRTFLKEQIGLIPYVNNKRYTNEAGVSTKYVGDDTFVLFPERTSRTTLLEY